MSVSTSAAAPSDKFEENQFMKDLVYLRDTQEAVQSLSGWCIRNRKFAYKISRCWLKCAKKVKTEQKLTLFYLLNDIVQHSKRKNYSDMLEKFEVVVKEVMPHMKEDRISEKILRCLNIWSERQVFPEKLVAELTAIIRSNKAEQDLIDNFQPQHLCTQIKILKALEDDTDYKLKTMKQSDLNLVEMDEGALRQNLKDKQHGSHYISDVDDAKQRLEQYIKAIDREIGKRRQVIELLTHGSKYYEGLLGEAKIVATAYSNFGKRITSNQTKLAIRLANFERTTKPKAAQDSKAASPQLGQSEYVPLGNGRNQEASNHCAPRPQGSGYESKAPHANEEWWNPPAATSWPDPKPDAWVPEHSDDIIPEWKIQAVDEEPSEEESYSQNHALQRLQRNVDTAASCDDYPRSFSAFHSGDHHTNVAVDMDVCSDDDMVTQSNGSQQPRSFSNVQDRLIMMACSSSAYYHNAASLPAGPAPAGVPVHGIPVPPPPPPPPPPPLHIANMSTPPPPPPPAAISFAPPGGVHGGYHRPAVAPRGRSYGIRVRGRGLRR